jgi:formamidase
VVVAPIDIAALRAERARRTGHDMRAHLRSEVHDYLRRGWLAPGGAGSIAQEDIERRIADAKRKL